MPVTQEQVDALNRIYGFLEAEVKKEGSDAKGIYQHMELDSYYPGTEKNPLRRFTRYCFYELKARDEDETKRWISHRLKETAFLDRCRMEENARELQDTGATVQLGDTKLTNWLNAQKNIAYRIGFHYTQPIRVEI
jgi:hypothetical protein